MTTYYTKKGRRYVPVLEKDIWNGDVWPEGAHLVICKPGIKTTKYNIEPNDSAYIAACTLRTEKIAKMFIEASQAKCKPAPYTQEQKDAWEALQTAYNGGPYYVQYDSAVEMAEKFLDLVRSEQQFIAKQDDCLYIGDIEER